MNNITLQEFILINLIDDKLIYKKNAENQLLLVRDTISQGLIRVPIFVISTHISKSCLLPVYGFKLKNGIEVIMRENFHGWVVSISSPIEISLPSNLVYGDGYENNENISSRYCEGFKDEWCFEFKTENFKKSTFRVDDDFKLFTLLYFLNDKLPILDLKRSYFEDLIGKKEDIKSIIEDYFYKHKNIKHFPDMFPGTYSMATNYNFQKKYNLPVFYDMDTLYEIIANNEELLEYFLVEKISFDWGENFK